MSLTVNGQRVGLRPFLDAVKRRRSQNEQRNPFGLTNRARIDLRRMAGDDYDPNPPEHQTLNGQTIHLPASAVAAQLPDDIPEPAFDRLERMKANEPDWP